MYVWICRTRACANVSPGGCSGLLQSGGRDLLEKAQLAASVRSRAARGAALRCACAHGACRLCPSGRGAGALRLLFARMWQRTARGSGPGCLRCSTARPGRAAAWAPAHVRAAHWNARRRRRLRCAAPHARTRRPKSDNPHRAGCIAADASAGPVRHACVPLKFLPNCFSRRLN